jgi:hypothetical protein
MADNGTVGRVRTGYVKGTSERMMKLGDEVTALLKKPKGQVTKKEMDDALAKVDEMRTADPPLDNQEKLNRLSYSNSLADRAVNEGLMNNEQKMARKDTVAQLVAGMYFGGGGGRMPSRGGGTGPMLPKTGAATGQKPLPAGGGGVAIASNKSKLDWNAVVPKKGKYKGEAREDHVRRHNSNDLSKENHGVFKGDGVDTTNKAWERAQDLGISPNANGELVVPMGGQVVGTSGGSLGTGAPLYNVKIIVQPGTSNVITSMPF